MIIGNAISAFGLRVGGGLDPQAQLYIDDAGIIDSIERNAINNLFIRIQDTPAIWDSIRQGFLYLVSPTHVAASYINAVSTTNFIPTPGGSGPIFSVDGWQFTGSPVHVLTGYIPSVEFDSISSGLIGWYCNTDTSTTGFAMGSLNGGTQRIEVADFNGGIIQFRAFNNSNVLDPAVANTIGSYACSIESSVLRHAIKDGVNLETDTNVVGGSLPSFETVLGARNNAGTIQLHSDRRYATFYQSKVGLSSANCIELSNAITQYNQNVISGAR